MCDELVLSYLDVGVCFSIILKKHRMNVFSNCIPHEYHVPIVWVVLVFRMIEASGVTRKSATLELVRDIVPNEVEILVGIFDELRRLLRCPSDNVLDQLWHKCSPGCRID